MKDPIKNHRITKDIKYTIGNKYQYVRKDNHAIFECTDIRMPSKNTGTIFIYYKFVNGRIDGSNSFMKGSEFDGCSFPLTPTI